MRFANALIAACCARNLLRLGVSQVPFGMWTTWYHCGIIWISVLVIYGSRKPLKNQAWAFRDLRMKNPKVVVKFRRNKRCTWPLTALSFLTISQLLKSFPQPWQGFVMQLCGLAGGLGGHVPPPGKAAPWPGRAPCRELAFGNSPTVRSLASPHKREDD